MKLKLIPILLLLFLMNAEAYYYPYEKNSDDINTISTALGVLGFTYSLVSPNTEPLSLYEIDNLMDKELLSINKFAVNSYNDDLSLISDILLGASVGIAALQIFDGRVFPEWGTYGIMLFQTNIITAGTANLTKSIVYEPRPYVYSEDAPIEMKTDIEAVRSFFSGHAALSFASMTFFVETYTKFYPENSNHNLIWLGSMALASSTAILRVFSGRHFPIDILIGSAVGFLVGKYTPSLYEKNSDEYFLINNKTQKIFSLSLNM